MTAANPATTVHAPAVDGIASALQAFLAPHGALSNFQPMADGHAGLTFGFELHGVDRRANAYILKRAPAGVPLRGSTDVFRQAPLLRALSRAGFPAPNVSWASDDVAILGAPFIIMERLPGRTVIVWDPSPESLSQFKDQSALWLETARLMGALHAFDWRAELTVWEEPTNLARELNRWTRLLRHTENHEHLVLAQRIAARLAATWPLQSQIGLIHGDLQPGNVLFEHGAARGLIDWDLAAIGPTSLDVGWLLMVADPASWACDWRPVSPPSRAAILDAYRDAGGTVPDDMDWHEAFAQFRMAAITGLNVKLHRDGRRHDPIWERFAASTPHLLRRADFLLG